MQRSGNAEIIEPYAVQDFYVDEVSAEIRDGNIFVTYCRKDGSAKVALVRLITSLARWMEIRAEVYQVVGAQPLIETPNGKALS